MEKPVISRSTPHLSDFPPDKMIRMSCDKCGPNGKHWQQLQSTLMERYGDIAMPDLLKREIQNCPRRESEWNAPCRPYYTDIAAQQRK